MAVRARHELRRLAISHERRWLALLVANDSGQHRVCQLDHHSTRPQLCRPGYGRAEPRLSWGMLDQTPHQTPSRGTQKGTQSPRQITYVEDTCRTRINLEINWISSKKSLCPCLAGKGSVGQPRPPRVGPRSRITWSSSRPLQALAEVLPPGLQPDCNPTGLHWVGRVGTQPELRSASAVQNGAEWDSRRQAGT
jgi:hypothetical protein